MSEVLKLIGGLLKRSPFSKLNSPSMRAAAMDVPVPRIWTYEELLAELPPEEGFVLELYHYLATEEKRVTKENNGITFHVGWDGGFSSQQKLERALKYGFVTSGGDYIPFTWLYYYSDDHIVGSDELRLYLREEGDSRAAWLLSNTAPLEGMDEHFIQTFGKSNFPVSIEDRHGYFWENQAHVTSRGNRETRLRAYV